MNKQVGFDKNKEFWECTECGYKNDISENNIYDICKDCGAKLTENDKHGLCSKCQTARNEEWVSRLKTGLKIFGSIAAAGTIYLVAKVSAENNSDDDSDTDYLDDSEDVENPEIEKSKVHLFKATKLGWDEEKEGVWFDSDDFTFEEAKQEFKEYQGTTYRGYPYTGYEYDGQKYHDVTYLGEFEEDELPHNDTELLDILLKKHNDRK